MLAVLLTQILLVGGQEKFESLPVVKVPRFVAFQDQMFDKIARSGIAFNKGKKLSTKVRRITNRIGCWYTFAR